MGSSTSASTVPSNDIVTRYRYVVPSSKPRARATSGPRGRVKNQNPPAVSAAARTITATIRDGRGRGGAGGEDSASGSIMTSSSVHLAPAGDREHRAEIAHVLGHQGIVLERGQVRGGSRLQPPLLLQVRQPRGPDGAQPNGLEAGHSLAGVVVMLQGPDRQHRVERRDRGVRSGTDLEASGDGRAKRVHARRPLFAQPSLVHSARVPPRGVERRLDRDRQAQGAGPSASAYGIDSAAVWAPIEPSRKRSPPMRCCPRSPTTHGRSRSAT